MNSKRNLAVACALACAGLVGCSGSSGNGVQTGTLVGAPASGLSYSTETQNGKTTAGGEYQFRAGETVSFRLGGLDIGSVSATPSLTLPDVMGVNLPADGDALSDALYSDALPTAMDRLVNFAVLLESLDADSTPENGIEITADVETLLSSSSIRLDMRFDDFARGGNIRDGLGLPGLLRAGAAEGLLSARPVAASGPSLQRIYGLQSAPFSAQAWTLRRDDDDADGVVDRARDIARSPIGRVLRDDYDSNGDGVVDTRYDYTYNDNNQQLGYTRDDAADGIIDLQRAVEYDAFGTLIQYFEETGAGSVIRSEVSIYNAAGKLVSLALQNSSLDRVEYWTVDDDGLRSTYELDEDNDGQIDIRALLTYPAGETRSDRWTRQDRDTNLDGSADIVIVREFDALGRKTLQTNDTNLDGLPEYEERLTYDSVGRITDYARDNDGGGIDYAYRWTYAPDGLTATRETDSDGDGVYEQVRNQSFSSMGDLVLDEYDNDGDGQVDSRNVYTYNSAGQRTERAQDTNADGNVDRRYVYEYDTSGQLVRETLDRFDDGVLDSITEYAGFVTVTVANYL